MTVGSTKPELHVDVWSKSPYTGTQKIIDTEGRVERFLQIRHDGSRSITKPLNLSLSKSSAVSSLPYFLLLISEWSDRCHG